MTLRTLRLVIEYDGTAYCGWQRQSGSASGGAPSVQAVLEAAVRDIAGEPAEVVGAGRTDAGVHACGQVARIATTSRIPVDRFPAALNVRLPPDIRVLEAHEASLDFHPRRDAAARTYRYDILNRPAPSALDRLRAYHVPEPLDVGAMQEALLPLAGRHDFTPYQATGGRPRTTICTVREAAWSRDADRLSLAVTADRFLRRMVRIIVGTLVRVGTGRLPASAPAEFLSDPDNQRTGPTAPPHGLYLVRVEYPAGPAEPARRGG